MMYKFKGKKVAILGLGKENKPLLDFLIKNDADITVCDKEKINLPFKKIKTRFGKNYLKNLTDFEIIFRTPGISYLQPEIQKAKENGVLVSSATKLFFDLCPAKIIGVTGSKGKSTTATLIFEILKQKFQSQGLESSVYLGGNIGRPVFSFLDKIKPTDWVILELSSFQLQDLHKSPHIAVVLNIFPEHQDYHNSIKEYFKAKENIVRHQKESDLAVINLENSPARTFAKLTKARVFGFSKKERPVSNCFIRDHYIVLKLNGKEIRVCSKKEIKLLGEHNLENILAAVLASYLAGAEAEMIRQAIRNFSGLPHRLEFVAEINGIKYINDSHSTTPESTVSAIKSFNEPIILIFGGRGKGGDYDKIINEIKENRNIKMVILIGELAKVLEKRFLAKVSSVKIINLGKKPMSEIVKTTQKEAEKGDVVLFSPGATSFDMFKNATKRGEKFKEAVLGKK